VGCIEPRAQDRLAQEDERGFVWSDEMAEGGDRGPSEGWTFPIPQEQVPTWDTKQEVFNITELFSIDKGTPTDSGAAAKRRAGGDYGVFDTWIEGAFQVHSSWSTRFEEADEAFRLQAKEAWIVAHGPSRSNTA
jgi:hypothetical protein